LVDCKVNSQISKVVWAQCFWTFGFYDSFLGEKPSNNIEPEDIKTMPKYSWMMYEVIDGMDLIWRQQRDWYLPTSSFRVLHVIMTVLS
jgi:hypothetical protein